MTLTWNTNELGEVEAKADAGIELAICGCEATGGMIWMVNDTLGQGGHSYIDGPCRSLEHGKARAIKGYELWDPFHSEQRPADVIAEVERLVP